MKILKRNRKALILSAVLMMTLGCVAQPPKPPSKAPVQQTDSINGNPVGTATVLMLSLGAAALGYKVRKNTKQNGEK